MSRDTPGPGRARSQWHQEVLPVLLGQHQVGQVLMELLAGEAEHILLAKGLCLSPRLISC